MADMELIIKIPDHLYKLLKDFPSDSNESTIENVLMKAVEHGTPLPKGHGRLIDADAYINKHEECGWLDDITVEEFNAITPTIIEADEEQTE